MPADNLLDFEDEDSFWVAVKAKDEGGDFCTNGYVRLSLAVIPKAE